MIKQLFFSITLINLSFSLFCMHGALQRMRLALPSAICVARMPKPHLMPQRSLIYWMHDVKIIEEEHVSKLRDKSVELIRPPSNINQSPDSFYFIEINSSCYLVENDKDVARIVAGLEKPKDASQVPPHFTIDGTAAVHLPKNGVPSITKKIFSAYCYKSIFPYDTVRWFLFRVEHPEKEWWMNR